MRSDEYVINLEKLFLGLGDKTRLRILNLIRNDEICVSYFTDILGESQPKISRHLAYLRKAGIVSARREGTWMHYSIDWPKDDHASTLIESLLESLASEPEMQKDRERLLRALGRTETVKKKKTPGTRSEEVAVPDMPAEEISYEREVYVEDRRSDELETFLL